MRKQTAVSRMCTALAHRGPDGEGRFDSRHVALGMRRLSVIDLEGGWQPFRNEDASLTLIASGEIYNSVELRARLCAGGHRFGSRSDCEVILHLYEDYGQDCVDHLRGMFAFALWDETARRLVLARDRMGERPLYLYEAAGGLLFASELKALLASGEVALELEPAHIDLYFHYQFVPEPRTPVTGVRKLGPGHLLTVDVDPWRVTERCYWAPEAAPPIDGDPGQVIASELQTVGRLVSRSDVPLGVALSGGLDSSVVAALVCSGSGAPLQAFTVGYKGCPPDDERPQAAEVARALGMEFNEIELDEAFVVEGLPDVIRASDDPIADMAGTCYHAVARRARQCGVRVLFQGQGADELFWGYSWTRKAMAASELKCLLWERGPLALFEYLRASMWTPTTDGNWKPTLPASLALIRAWQDFCCDSRDALGQLTFYDLNPDFRAAGEVVRGLYTDRFRSGIDPRGPFALFTVTPPREHLGVDLTRLVCQTYLLENGMAQGDRLSMSASVELRLPLVDHRLVEKIIGLRKTHSDHHLAPKSWLREAARALFPELPGPVLERPKRPFSPPLRAWHRRLFASYGHLLADGHLVELGVLRAQAARGLARGYFPPGAGSTLSFKALVLEIWCRVNRDPDQEILPCTPRVRSR